MSSLDRLNLATLRPCCIAVIHARPGIAIEEDTTICPCGGILSVDNGRWTRQEAPMQDDTTPGPERGHPVPLVRREVRGVLGLDDDTDHAALIRGNEALLAAFQAKDRVTR